jgi:hypothetical protein
MTQSFLCYRLLRVVRQPRCHGGGSSVVDAPPMCLPPPPVGFWPPTGPGFWHPPPQSYPGQPFSTLPPQTDQGYWTLLQPMDRLHGGHCFDL